MFGRLRNGILAFGLSLALLGAGGFAWADLPSAGATAQTTEATTDVGPGASEPRLFTLSELSFFFESLVTNDQAIEQLSELSNLTGGATSVDPR